jgi:hypothetical protein
MLQTDTKIKVVQTTNWQRPASSVEEQWIMEREPSLNSQQRIEILAHVFYFTSRLDVNTRREIKTATSIRERWNSTERKIVAPNAIWTNRPLIINLSKCTSATEGPTGHSLQNTWTNCTQHLVDNHAVQTLHLQVGRYHLRWQHQEVTALHK